MFRNYFKVAFRNVLRNKSASLIKVISLSVGMICFGIIALFVNHELSYDRFHQDTGRVYRVVKDFVNDDGSTIPDATTPPALAPVIQQDLPEVAYTTRLFPNWGRKYLLQYGDTQSYEQEVVRIDSSFFDVFTFPFIKGQKAEAVASNNFIILTESTAQRLFGNEDPMGKIITIDLGDPGLDLHVSGVVADVPGNSHFQFDFLIPIRTFNGPIDQNWNFYNFYTYVRLKPGADADQFQTKLQPLYNKYRPQGQNQFYAQALTDIHLKSNLKWELSANGDYSYVEILATIGIFTIILAAINYINLVTAQSSRRAREVGVRKVSGAVKRSLIGQFLFESLIIAGVSTLISIAAIESMLPRFQNIFNASLSLFDPQHRDMLVLIILTGVVTGLVAGIYPAFYLSSFKPVNVLKGSLAGVRGDGLLRKVLVTVQFTISTVLIIGTFVISGQINFVRNKNLGFAKDNVLLIHNTFRIPNRDAFITEIKGAAGVVNAGSANGVLGGQNWTTSVAAKGSENFLLLNFIDTDYDFLDVMGVDFKSGRNFSVENPADSTAVVLNETAVAQLGIHEPVVGTEINTGSADDPYYYKVIGVIGDFHFSSFHEPIKPFGFFLGGGGGGGLNTIFVKVASDETQATIDRIHDIWSKGVPSRPFEFSFQDEQIARLYASEVKFQNLFSNFTYVSIVLACLGLFGLSAYTAQQRTKEIGIRKVLGATVLGVTGLLSKEFLKVVLLSVFISVPIAWYAMEAWLQNFAYRIDLEAWMFIMSGAVAIIIALVTVSFQSVKAALANPVNSLRNE